MTVESSDKNTVICTGSTNGTLVGTQKPGLIEKNNGTKPVLTTPGRNLGNPGRTQGASTGGMVDSRHSREKNRTYNTTGPTYASVVQGLV